MNKEPFKKGEKKDRNEKGQFVGGKPGGPGRPKGTISIITAAKKVLREHPERLGMIVEDLLTNDKLRLELIRQIDGMPKQSHEIQADIKSEIELNDEQFNQLIRRRGKELDSKEARERKAN